MLSQNKMKEIYPNFLSYLKSSYKRLLTVIFTFIMVDIFAFFIIYNLSFKETLIDNKKEYLSLNNEQVLLFVIISILLLFFILAITELIVFVCRLRKKNYEKQHCWA